jgi:translation initiation factor IF-1
VSEPATVGDATILEVLPQALYRVQMNDGTVITAHIAASMRMTYVRALPGDRVRIELSPYDRSRARITKKLS